MDSLQLLNHYFGYTAFRPGQETLIDSLLDGQDVVGIMPTGSGKSLCYQIPALMFSGITLIVSPLISLMQDQVGALVQAGVPAAYLNSSLSPRQMALALENGKEGRYKLIYVAPERLMAPDFLHFAHSVSISMVTIDEAHCISQWGQDFRPSYLAIPDFIDSLSIRPVISAFTATATKRVEEDIAHALRLNDPKVLVTGFDRSNLYFSVESPRDKTAALLNFLAEQGQESGIVYCNTRKTVEEVAEKLNHNGYPATLYHAGLSDDQRKENQTAFLLDRYPIMVATNAFGMGINKPNVSFVVHYNMPKDLESYYQEAGRAGRDGRPAKCILFYSSQDRVTATWLITNSRENREGDTKASETQIEQDMARLQKMVDYSTSTTCLRGFILEYFGESILEPCGDCGVCNTNFSMVDATVDAQKLLSCVARMNQRYGATLVISVLRGSKSKRIQELNFHTLSTYGICKKPQGYLQALIQYLVQSGFLQVSNDGYSILSLTPSASQVLKGETKVTLPLAQSVEKEIVSSTQTASRSISGTLSPERRVLFDALAQVRSQLARGQGVPSYVIFGDRTLVDLCQRLPTTTEGFREIFGVGDVKTQRYSKEFLPIIQSYCQEHSLTPLQKGRAPSRSSPQIFTPPPPGLLAEIPPSPTPLLISALVSLANDALESKGCTLVNVRLITGWLLKEGYLQYLGEERRGTTVTEMGLDEGITQEGRVGADGSPYTVNLYPEKLQAKILNAIGEILQEHYG